MIIGQQLIQLFAKGKPDLTYLKGNEDNFIFEVSKPMYCMGEINPITGSVIRGRHWGYRLLDETTGNPVLEIKPETITEIYKLDSNGHIFINKIFHESMRNNTGEGNNK